MLLFLLNPLRHHRAPPHHNCMIDHTRSCSVGQIFMPVAMMDCLVANSSEQKDEIAFVSRQYGLYGAAWLLYVAKGKAHLPNMCVLVTVIVLSCTLSYFGEGKTIVHNDGECSSTWMGQGMWSIGWPVLAMILAYVERHTTDDRHKAPDAAENQTLV